MMLKKKNQSKLSMANLVVRLIFIVFSILMIISLIFTFQYSSKAINYEVDRTLTQTASLVQNLFEHKLESIQGLQDTQAKSTTLLNYVKSEAIEQIEDYFVASEKADISSFPDFRFIQRHNEIYWEDGNSPFFGIKDDQLLAFSKEIAFNNSWHQIAVETDVGRVHLLIRKTPLVDVSSGEVIGRLFFGVVLDNNYALVDYLKIGSNTEDIILAVDSIPVASTMRLGEELPVKGEKLADNELYSQVELKINGVETPVSVYTIQTNQSILTLEKNFRLSIIYSVLSIVATAIFARFLIQRRIAGELETLMEYTHNARETRASKPFPGSVIYEFEHIGMTLEHTFEELLEKEKLFQDLFNYAVSPIIVWDRYGNLRQMNPAAEKAFEKEGSFSGPVFKAFQKQIEDKLRAVRSGAILSGINIGISDTVYRWNISPIFLENGVSTIIGQGLDITTLIEAEKQSNLAREEAEKAASERADFLARMSHEIRTPLNGILGISHLLKKSVEQEEQKKKVDVLVQSSEHLLAVLNDILDFSKIEQGKFKIVPKNFLLSDVVNSVENIYKPLCHDKGIQLRLRATSEHKVYIRTDQVRLNQILFNLLSNSVKFTHVGHVKASLSLDSTEVGATYLEIVIEDTGIGISEKNLQHIFEPFVQSEKTSTREYEGTGLGLAIVKHLVDMLKGHIEIKSAEGLGTSIKVALPVEVVDGEKVERDEAVVENHQNFFSKQLKTLIVEDNQTNAYIAKAFCKKYAMSVDWAKDAFTALEMLESTRYDLILMDNQMPNMDGIEATTRIREMKIDTPVIACTADGYEETKQAFLAAGADYVLVKPIKDKSFLQALTYYKQINSV
ncbi:ATP-binding protein [Vibrio sp. JC009]|uniref:LuxQ periplasmic sensor domain-containing protein n=1 Tax=Vibrio sp. JC009 TaxID=2912314 RepID=UPI0023AED262|nr:LuxQ periplasmic sensor domain-containing protein [Vibrio sp. JC009]WED24224.1 ATP-binding protein [Vibrio sp. JC009]